MTLTNAEKQRNFRERQRQKRKQQLSQASTPDVARFYRRPFFEWADEDGNWSDFLLYLDVAGIEPPDFGDDRGPASFSGEVEALAEEAAASAYPNAINSLGRAEVMIGALIDAAATLAGIVNSYKRRELEARISEIENADLSDRETKQHALSEIVRLKKQLEQLDGEIRSSFRRWKAEP